MELKSKLRKTNVVIDSGLIEQVEDISYNPA